MQSNEGGQRVYTPGDLADLLGVSAYWVSEQTRTGRFPYLRVGRSIRFTAEHVAEIHQILEVRPNRAGAGGPEAVSLPGLSARSRSYHARRRAS